ncbi:MAG TPA: membrane protein insertase YidC [Moorella mulderi]|nr:membrane protein insertase YidC [Moorella mulderi]
MRPFVDLLSHLLQYLYEFTKFFGLPSYGLAIILFTITVKIALFPLTYKQLISMKRLQELQPKLQDIQKKYKNNPQKAQQAMMELYQKEGINPLSGCLPLLIQMPILIALFATLCNFFDSANHPPYVEVDHANFLWIPNLGQPDPYILPILVVLATFFQQKLGMAQNPKDHSTKLMLYFMPLLFGWMSRSFPAGLSLYWIAFSLLSMLEQWWIRRQSVLLKGEGGTK